MPKQARDPGAPKRNLTAYLLYQNAIRERLKAENPGISFGNLSKLTSALYAQLSPEEKEEWQARSEADKQRYLQELANYAPPPGYDHKGDTASPAHPAAKHGSQVRGARDANAPKRNVSAYLHYQNAMRDKFRTENPGMTFGQLSKYTSHMYKNLTPEEREHWEQVSIQDKKRYEIAMAAYQPPPSYDKFGNSMLYEDSTKKSRKKPRDPAAPKRARGSFVFFTFDMRPKIMAEFPGIRFVDIGTILGERWRSIAPEEKLRYEEMAAKDKIRFNVEMQNYCATYGSANPEGGMHPPSPEHAQLYAGAADMNQYGVKPDETAYEPTYESAGHHETYDAAKQEGAYGQPQYDPANYAYDQSQYHQYSM